MVILIINTLITIDLMFEESMTHMEMIWPDMDLYFTF